MKKLLDVKDIAWSSICARLHDQTDKVLVSNVSLAGLLTVLMTCTDMKTFICGKYHYFLYYLTLSIYPRMLVTLNEELEPVQASVRVGQAVDTVGQAGKPKRITGFQTHDTPVLIGCSERAELATEQYIPESTVMENFVIVRPNPDYNPEEDFKKKWEWAKNFLRNWIYMLEIERKLNEVFLKIMMQKRKKKIICFHSLNDTQKNYYQFIRVA